jgi:rhomboid protease GluP
MRQQSGSVVCSRCGRLVDVDEPTCPHCGQWRPGMFGYAGTLRRVFGNVDVTQLITGFCVLLYLISLVLDPMQAARHFFSPTTRSLYQLGMTGGAASKLGHWYTVFSATFLHGSPLHILFNMLWIRFLGPTVEDYIGPARYFLLFLIAGAGGFVLSNAVGAAPTVGASGAIFGLFGAHIVLGRHHGGSLGDAVSQRSLMWAALLFVMGFFFPHTNNMAHLGGFLTGYVMTRVLVGSADRPEGPIIQVTALLAALVTVGSVILSFVTVSAILMRGG